ncbi:DNA cytosine methyltransferase [Streptomyces sp. RY43-2]|uniref:DNA cytosine methyltransferase n=1 Tax=Streptomyces macrolidinus TaxID=2952607 RepID=A0ABT0ZAA3_9ACTN|nr:DNA cytosine methyltransferase [Streptomyces macrolidinus]MCN9240693.1 DNA cytosine methyltransferase [Streptomyces macrolidinus]
MADGTQSGLWLHIVRAIESLNPCMVVIENVRGLLTSPAGSPGDVEPCPWCLGDTAGQPAVRALGAVLGSLADLGFDARWCVLRASDVGAPHRRERVFLAAWPSWRTAAAENADEQPGDERRQSASGQAEGWRARPEPGGRGGVAAADAEGVRRAQGIPEPTPRQRGLDLALGGSPLAACPGHGVRAHDRTAHGGPLQDAYDAGTGAVRGGRPQTWGPYAAAISRWERVTGPAPLPTDEAGRLSPLFVEWMQGLDPGWVTATPGLGRPAQLAALGNGVVPQQAAQALEILAPPVPLCCHHRSR